MNLGDGLSLRMLLLKENFILLSFDSASRDGLVRLLKEILDGKFGSKIDGISHIIGIADKKKKQRY